MLSSDPDTLKEELTDRDHRFTDVSLSDEEMSIDQSHAEELFMDKTREISLNPDRLKGHTALDSLSTDSEVRTTIAEAYMKYKSETRFPDTLGDVEAFLRPVVKSNELDIDGNLADFCRSQAKNEDEREKIYECICLKEISNGD